MMDADTILQELPVNTGTELFRRLSRPSNPFTAATQNIHFVMRQLEQIFDPHTSHIPCFQNIMLISLDLEFDHEKIHQVGISTFDVNQIAHVNTNLPQSILDVITNHLYLLQRNAVKIAKCQYRYGEPQLAKNLPIQTLLLPFLTRRTKAGQPYNIILIGHSIHQDVLILQRHGFDMTQIPNLISFTDVAPLASYFLNDTTKVLSLKHICRRLGMRTCGFHNAAHDALYTLQALLLLFHRYKSQKEEAANIWPGFLSFELSTTRDKKRDPRLLWQCQLDAIRYVADQSGSVLWTGSPIQRKRRESYISYKDSERKRVQESKG